MARADVGQRPEVDDAIEVVLDRFGSESGAVGEGHALSQVEGELRAVLVHLPVLGEPAHDLPGLPVLVDEGVGDLTGHCAGDRLGRLVRIPVLAVAGEADLQHGGVHLLGTIGPAARAGCERGDGQGRQGRSCSEGAAGQRWCDDHEEPQGAWMRTVHSISTTYMDPQTTYVNESVNQFSALIPCIRETHRYRAADLPVPSVPRARWIRRGLCVRPS